MKPYINHAVYPDRAANDGLIEDFADDLERADYLERICGAWDFDIPPELETFKLFQGWHTVFDLYPLPHSPAYHAFRTLYRWPAAPRVRRTAVHLTFQVLDRAEGRDPDPYIDVV